MHCTKGVVVLVQLQIVNYNGCANGKEKMAVAKAKKVAVQVALQSARRMACMLTNQLYIKLCCVTFNIDGKRDRNIPFEK